MILENEIDTYFPIFEHIATQNPFRWHDHQNDHPTLFPACVFTHAQHRKLTDIDLSDAFMSDHENAAPLLSGIAPLSPPSVTQAYLR